MTGPGRHRGRSAAGYRGRVASRLTVASRPSAGEKAEESSDGGEDDAGGEPVFCYAAIVGREGRHLFLDGVLS